MPGKVKNDKYNTVSFLESQLKEIDGFILRNPELGYTGRPEVFRELLREWIEKMNEYEANKEKREIENQ